MAQDRLFSISLGGRCRAAVAEAAVQVLPSELEAAPAAADEPVIVAVDDDEDDNETGQGTTPDWSRDDWSGWEVPSLYEAGGWDCKRCIVVLLCLILELLVGLGKGQATPAEQQSQRPPAARGHARGQIRMGGASEQIVK